MGVASDVFLVGMSVAFAGALYYVLNDTKFLSGIGKDSPLSKGGGKTTCSIKTGAKAAAQGGAQGGAEMGAFAGPAGAAIGAGIGSLVSWIKHHKDRYKICVNEDGKVVSAVKVDKNGNPIDG